MSHAIAIVGVACRYPDADSPKALWEMALAKRRAFRRMPDQRLNNLDYISSDPAALDSTYVEYAAVLRDYEFDRVRFRVPGHSFRSADMAHWLALDVADQALRDAGFADGQGLPRESTGVYLGNTLTGEFSRANTLRLRWPFVRRVVAAGLAAEGWSSEQRGQFLQQLEQNYKAPFPIVDAETLAGGLSNTIAGRICNHFDLMGGGYSVDGACSSSLLAITTACTALASGEVDVALAGGVDLSLDPFELVGFARAGALATDLMRIYDQRSAGFWPGEGCGFVTLMRAEDAYAEQRPIYAVIRGWGISSDGSGGITRPEVAGQVLMLKRAYRRTSFNIDQVGYFEGHGTGTAVGDATELQAIAKARLEVQNPNLPIAAVGSIKANIGHTKAAAGIAGFIKATMAVHSAILPPTTGCEQPHSALETLRVLATPEAWPEQTPRRAGVSSMGFGGINAHIVLEQAEQAKPASNWQPFIGQNHSQDLELIVVAKADRQALLSELQQLRQRAEQLSYAELGDLASHYAQTNSTGLARAAVIANNPRQLATKLDLLIAQLEAGVNQQLDFKQQIFIGIGKKQPTLGLLFPGQGAPQANPKSAVFQRFTELNQFLSQTQLSQAEQINTANAQPNIVRATLAGLDLLKQFKLQASAAVGHSLGELSALHWAGAYDQASLIELAQARGHAMANYGQANGGMASIGADPSTIKSLINGDQAVIAGYNGPQQTVIAGSREAMTTLVERAQQQGLAATNLAVSHAFHSPMMQPAIPVLQAHVANLSAQPLQSTVYSTITGTKLSAQVELGSLLSQQLTDPVRFVEAIDGLSECDLLIEVGPGTILSRLASECIGVPAVSLEVESNSLAGLFKSLAAAFVLGSPLDLSYLAQTRFSRPFDVRHEPSFLTNPCETAPAQLDDHQPSLSLAPSPSAQLTSPTSSNATDPLQIVRELVAARSELPLASINDSDHVLGDLHLNSLTVGQIVSEAARLLGLQPPLAPTSYANATVGQLAQAISELQNSANTPSVTPGYPGIAPWVESFVITLVEQPVPAPKISRLPSQWQLFHEPNYALAPALSSAFQQQVGQGVVVCVGETVDAATIERLLEAARFALSQSNPQHFVLVQHGEGLAGFARTLALENPQLAVAAVHVPIDAPQACDWIVAEALASTGYLEAHYDHSGRRTSPILQLLHLGNDSELPLGPDDVILATGGGKGITAESVYALAKASGAKLALLGRSQPSNDQELAQNLERMQAAGITVGYWAVDVGDATSVQQAMNTIQDQLGTVTMVLHGAARNVPSLIRNLDRASFEATLTPKVQGLNNVLAALDQHQLRFVVGFGSIIGRMGLAGDADYAVANEQMRRIIEQGQHDYPNCRWLSIEWSIWSDVGMGVRLGGVDQLLQAGISPIPPDTGINLLLRLLSNPIASSHVVITGRYGELPTLQTIQPELPFLRFLERQCLYYPQIELIVEAQLSSANDPYVVDHSYHGEQLFPTVIGLEAMAQVAMALTGSQQIPTFEQVALQRPIVVPANEPLTIRICSLQVAKGVVKLAIRSQETLFQVDHFSAVARFEQPANFSVAPNQIDWPVLKLDPVADIYEPLLFHQGRFQRLQNYRYLTARHCIANLATRNEPWFGRYLPQRSVLGDAGMRDALIHALQVCVPYAQVLPVAVERISCQTPSQPSDWTIYAQERAWDGNMFTYDVIAVDQQGNVVEEWQGLRLQLVEGSGYKGAWPTSLLGAYLERQVRQVLPHTNMTIAVETDPALERQQRSDLALQRAIGQRQPIQRRSDGKPEVADYAVSASHHGSLTLAIAAKEPISCDLEPISPRSVEQWLDLLGAERMQLAKLIQQQTGWTLDQAATQIWTALECLSKVGAAFDSPLRFEPQASNNWLVLQTGQYRIVSQQLNVRDAKLPIVVSLLVGA